jgi:hypothetical protein
MQSDRTALHNAYKEFIKTGDELLIRAPGPAWCKQMQINGSEVFGTRNG